MIKKIMNSDVEILQEQTRLRPKKVKLKDCFQIIHLQKTNIMVPKIFW